MHVERRAGAAEHVRRGRDVVEVDGEPLAKQRLAYVLLHKPAGVVTTARDPQGRPTVVGLVAHPARVVPVGRLDARHDRRAAADERRRRSPTGSPTRATASTRSTSPTGRQPTDGALRSSRDGVDLDDGRTAPARVRRLGGARFELTLHEGRNQQVKRMLAAVGHRVRHLHRSGYAGR